MSAVRSTIQNALAYHQAGKLAEAERLYRAALDVEPNNPDALNLLGVLARQTGRADVAVNLIRQALNHAPGQPVLLSNLGNALLSLNRHDEAVEAYRAALVAQPRDANTHHNLGKALAALDRRAEALEAFKAALKADPGHADASLSLSAALMAASRFEEAVPLLRRQAQRTPTDAKILVNLGEALRRLGRLDEALPPLRKARQIDPNLAEAALSLGQVLSARGDLADAAEAFQAASTLKPDMPEARFRFGVALEALGDLPHAEQEYAAAVRLQPENAGYLLKFGIAQTRNNRFEEGLESFRSALRIDPAYVAAKHGEAAALHQLGRFDESLAAGRAAVAMDPGSIDSYSNLGNLLLDMNRPEEAVEATTKALELSGGKARLPRANRAYAALALMDFTLGWDDYRFRDLKDLLPDRDVSPLGDDLSGQTILLQAEQGLGDELFFLRFAPEVKRRGARVLYRATPRMKPLLADWPALDGILVDEPPPAGARIVQIGDLPYQLGMRTGDTCPPPVPLRADPELRAGIADRLAAAGPGPYLGVTWRGGTAAFSKLFKEVPVGEIGRILAGLPGTLVVLQRQPKPEEMAAFRAAVGDRPVVDLSALNEELPSILAAMDVVDRYVAVSNTNVHFRAGLGHVSNVLVPRPEFRWLARGEESPWFPGHPISRASLEDGWGKALARLEADLGSGLR